MEQWDDEPEGAEGRQLQYVFILLVVAFCLNYFLRSSLIKIRDHAREQSGGYQERHEPKESPLPQIGPLYVIVLGWFLYFLVALVTGAVGLLGAPGNRLRMLLGSGGADAGQREDNLLSGEGSLTGTLDDPEPEEHTEGRDFS
ncbi:hypothetical protein [Neorickettsia sennetsu]|uniref:Uncharacterized protein n=1 Tax=Ehrlichia sennetsu (strain ATCC VR-367 / Miyayama) TaxID=222891 RepID=Q2GDB5_EHRS3|nr:hypothetical protein [Neorickettsia sennetsu]ABD45607.1 hypothetical protein NSE_0653 [Neorickettsia sennetsu str. Miyayama]